MAAKAARALAGLPQAPRPPRPDRRDERSAERAEHREHREDAAHLARTVGEAAPENDGHEAVQAAEPPAVAGVVPSADNVGEVAGRGAAPDSLPSDAKSVEGEGRRAAADPVAAAGTGEDVVSRATHTSPAPRREPRAGRQGQSQRRAPAAPPSPIHVDRAEIERATGAPAAARFERRLREAARAFDMERFSEALPKLRALAQEAPSAASVRELYGLALYRVARWADAARELEAFATLTNSTEQHPVIADCYRALRRWDDVERLWLELRETSPSAELVNEGRIVMAGALADRGELNRAVVLLAKGFSLPKRPQPHHLRRMYTLADLHERSGALAEARSLFRQIATIDPDFFDVVDRVRALG